MREVWVTVFYKGEELGKQRVDMIVDNVVVVESKARYDLPKEARRQLYNYLRATNLEVGLLLHFGPEPSFQRVVSLNSDQSIDSSIKGIRSIRGM